MNITLMPLTSSSSNEPISNASAALTSPLGGTSGGGYCMNRWHNNGKNDSVNKSSGQGPAKV